MKNILRLLLLFTFSTCSIYAQTKKHAIKKFTDEVTGFSVAYPDSITPVILKNKEDIKAEVEPFVLEIYAAKKAAVSAETISDDCYKFTQAYTNKYKIAMKEFLCTEGAAGTTYYSYIYLIEKGQHTILLKFLHKHCNSCTNKQGKTIPFNNKKDIRWIKDIVESVQVK
jgi:hypothetical protein